MPVSVSSSRAIYEALKDGGIKDGGKTIIIRLKRGLRWSKGSEITSADVRFGWRVDMDDALRLCRALGLPLMKLLDGARDEDLRILGLVQ